MTKRWIKSKTIIFAMLLAGVGAVQASMDVLTPYMTPQIAGLATVIVGVVVAVLRVLTTTSLADKDK